MNWLYLLALLGSIAGMMILDARFKVALFRRALSTVLMVGFGVAALIIVDLYAIEHAIFVRGESPYLLGIWLTPHIPLEEPIFLAFLSYCTLVIYGLLNRWVETRRGQEGLAPNDSASEVQV
ncbi:lycopene cyclase domain-containing protein [Rothia sp. LK2492]|uniref:lycopene cyclase domain-containing protein n=1 Tax=Rothia sp. LK2492 TaxID=3114370 RepID=UPI0034CE2426